jgi:hypothetical protein
LQAQRNLLDEAKGAEDSLLDVVNMAYNFNFKNLNHLNENFPGIDWQANNTGIGLQVTTTKTWQKISSTIEILIRNNVETAKEIWFLFISTEKYSPRQENYNGYKIKTITIADLLDKISSLSDIEIVRLRDEIQLKFSAWIYETYQAPTSSYLQNSYSTPSISPINFITHHNLWDSLGDQTIVADTVLKQINGFASHYSSLPPIAKTVIAKIVQHAPQPSWLNWHLEINIEEFSLYLSDNEKSNFNSIISILKTKYLGHMIEKNHEVVECGDDTYIMHTPYLQLTGRVCEPDYDIFTAFKSFYSMHLSEHKLYSAFELGDFSDLN